MSSDLFLECTNKMKAKFPSKYQVPKESELNAPNPFIDRLSSHR